jgi:hypothetical protein
MRCFFWRPFVAELNVRLRSRGLTAWSGLTPYAQIITATQPGFALPCLPKLSRRPKLLADPCHVDFMKV